MFKNLRSHIRRLMKGSKVDSRALAMSIRYMQHTGKRYPYKVIFGSCDFIGNTAQHNALINRN